MSLTSTLNLTFTREVESLPVAAEAFGASLIGGCLACPHLNHKERVDEQKSHDIEPKRAAALYQSKTRGLPSTHACFDVQLSNRSRRQRNLEIQSYEQQLEQRLELDARNRS